MLFPGQPAVVPAIHLCPWTCECSLPNASGSSAPLTTDKIKEVEKEHPKKSTVTTKIPPSYSHCKQAIPVLKNIIHQLVMERAASEGHQEDLL